jgi:hypothetical protein
VEIQAIVGNEYKLKPAAYPEKSRPLEKPAAAPDLPGELRRWLTNDSLDPPARPS